MIFVDESIQQKHGYICTAFVYSQDDVNFEIAAALTRAGLDPGRSEFKSGARMDSKQELQILRRDLLGIIQDRASVGLLISAESKRNELGREVCGTLRRIIVTNNLAYHQQIFVDRGIAIPKCDDLSWLQQHGARLEVECDSKQILGIQLADHAAYHCSYILKEKIEGPTKHMRVGEESGYIEPFDAELGWVFWTDLRYCFFKESKEWNDEVGDRNFIHKLLGYGAFVSDDLPQNIRQHALSTFETVWMGCIH